jgi:hypothetical protein
MTGDATAAMAVATSITLRLALIIDLADRFSNAPAPLRSAHLALHKTNAGHEIVLENVQFTLI